MNGCAVETEVLVKAVGVACRAPSLHNTQPWRWAIDGDTVHLFLDKTRVLYSTDRSGREALLACGAVLDHFRVAMAAAGWAADVDRYPDPNDTTHLATFRFTPLEPLTDVHGRRADAIMIRRTDRLPFSAPADWGAVEQLLHQTITSDAVHLDVIADELRPELVEASRLTESLRFYDSSYHEELQWWTAPFAATQGIPRNELPTAAEGDRVDIGRRFPMPLDERDRRRTYGTDRSKVVVLSTRDSDRASVLECGEMLSAVLLEATVAGLATCTLSHVTELAASREVVACLIGRATTPQLLIRVGSAPAIEQHPPATPRRPLSEVLEVRNSSRH
ncbi:Acg family FMN-binding oxidoreductase [Mycolicibacterium rutilum]|nr:NAD(P)H nitroreductase [Mycolicibacterium rutilum]